MFSHYVLIADVKNWGLEDGLGRNFFYFTSILVLEAIVNLSHANKNQMSPMESSLLKQVGELSTHMQTYWIDQPCTRINSF